MSHSYMPQRLTPPSFKKKMLTTIVVVALGHVVTLWAVSHMQAPSLHKIEKEPLQVRFVKIKQEQTLPPIPKAEPKTEPKPKEVKVVEQAPPPPPKKVERVQAVKTESAKAVVATVEKPSVKPTPAPVVVPVVEAPPKPTAAPAPVVVEAPPQPAPTPVAPAAPAGPKSVAIGGSGVQWSRSPKPQYTDRELKGEARHVVVEISADEKGKVTDARIIQSTGIPALDQKVLRSVRSSRFKPYKENGVAYPIKAELPLDLTLSPKG